MFLIGNYSLESDIQSFAEYTVSRDRHGFAWMDGKLSGAEAYYHEVVIVVSFSLLTERVEAT